MVISKRQIMKKITSTIPYASSQIVSVLRLARWGIRTNTQCAIIIQVTEVNNSNKALQDRKLIRQCYESCFWQLFTWIMTTWTYKHSTELRESQLAIHISALWISQMPPSVETSNLYCRCKVVVTRTPLTTFAAAVKTTARAEKCINFEY